MRDFLNVNALDLTKQSAVWAEADARYRQVAPYIYGARVLRQPPVECLFEFICSSNNHISRITGMVEHLCRAYGTQLHTVASSAHWHERDNRQTRLNACSAVHQSDASLRMLCSCTLAPPSSQNMVAAASMVLEQIQCIDVRRADLSTNCTQCRRAGSFTAAANSRINGRSISARRA